MYGLKAASVHAASKSTTAVAAGNDQDAHISDDVNTNKKIRSEFGAYVKRTSRMLRRNGLT
jgi:CRISPR/Cas system CMR-associated protein Cmr5 small subunit